MIIRLSLTIKLILYVLAIYLMTVLPSRGDNSSQALHLIDYISTDYPITVRDGVIIDTVEYAEQIEFLSVLREVLTSLPEKDGKVRILKKIKELKHDIIEKKSPSLVAEKAKKISKMLVDTYHIIQTPDVTPNPEKGALLYTEYCAACHGKTGHGDGPASVGLYPKPTNLLDEGHFDNVSLYAIYNTITLGVQGTSMLPFSNQLNSKERWDLATYTAGLSVPPTFEDQISQYSLSDTYSKTPSEVMTEDGLNYAQSFRYQRAHPKEKMNLASQLIQHTIDKLNESLYTYSYLDDPKKAYDLSIAAYLEGFELIESSLDNIDTNLRKGTEKSLLEYRRSLQEHETIIKVQQSFETAINFLMQTKKTLDTSKLDWSLSYISGFLILLREGLEAVLVLASILAYLKNTNQKSVIRSVHIGWVLSLFAGVTTWLIASYIIKISGAGRELLEGYTALFSSIMVLWLGVWMHDHRHANARRDQIKSVLRNRGSSFSLAFLAFISVYRELFEIILFYEALWIQSGPNGHNAVLIGAASAFVVLLILAKLILKSSERLPLGKFFSINAILLCSLSIIFAGHGIKALQEAGSLEIYPIPFFEFSWLGIYSDAFSLSAQIIAISIVTLFYTRDKWFAKSD